MQFTLPLRLSRKRLSRHKRPPSPPASPPPTFQMFAGKAKQVVIDLDDSSDDDHEYGTPLTGSQIGEDLRLGADEDGDGHRIPFTFLDERDFEPHMDYFLPDVAPEPVDAESACLNRVLEVFPDIDHEHVRQLYQARPVVAEEARPSGDPSGELIVKILDAGDYPKEKDRRKELKRKRAASAGSSQGETAAWEAADRERGSTQYSEEARSLLKEEFPYVPTRFVDQAFRQHGHLYQTYFALEHEERIYHDSKLHPYTRIKNPRKQKAGSCLSEFPLAPAGPVVIELLKELEAARKKRRKEDIKRQLQKDEEDAEASNEREHRENGMMMECQCCFDDVPINKATHCDGEEPHFFCLECAKRNANNEIGNSRYKLLCMDGSGCKAEFAKEQMRRFLEEKAMDKLERLQQQEEIRLADLDDLTSCPFCDFAAICPPVEEDREFRCANPECEKVSCRLCKLETHIPLSCEVNAKENKVNVRHAVEEAMTEALVRSCHKCKNKYIKEFGCNKMMCMRCSSIQCYVCSKDITKDGYSHFNESARGGRPGQCPLFDNTEQRHDEEVRKAEQKALDKVRAENPGFSEEELKVKVSDAVQKNERERIRQAGAAHGHYVPPRIPDIARPPLPGLQEVDIGVPIAAINERRQQLLADLARGNRERQEGVGARLEAAQAWVQAAQGRGQGGQARVQAAQVRMAQAAEARTQAAKERAQAAQARAQTAIARAQAAQAQVQLRVNTQAPAQAPANFQAQPWIQEPPQPFPGLRDPMHFGFGNDLYPPHPFGDPYNAAIPGFPLLAGGLHGQPFPAPQVFARHNQFWHGPEEGQPDGDMLNPFGNGAFGRL